jgi:Cys-rich protein (TIGR01571 family)
VVYSQTQLTVHFWQTMARALFPSAILICTLFAGVAALDVTNSQKKSVTVITPDEHSVPQTSVEASFSWNQPRKSVLLLLESVLPAARRPVMPSFLVHKQQPAQPAGQEEPEQTPEQQAGDRLIIAIVGALFAFVYKQYFMKTPPQIEDPNVDHAQFAVFESEEGGKKFYNPMACIEDRAAAQGCFCAVCCPCIRWAETISYVNGLLPFWQAYFAFLVCWYMLGITITAVLGWAATTALGVYYRREMRAKLAGKAVGDFLIKDICSWCWCSCCMIAQEARHIEGCMRKTDHPEVVHEKPEPKKMEEEAV